MLASNPLMLERVVEAVVCAYLGTEQGTRLSTILFDVSLPVDSDFFQYVVQATSQGNIKLFQLRSSKLFVQYLHVLEQKERVLRKQEMGN